MNEYLNPASAPAAAGPYSTAVRTGNGFLFLSGQIGAGDTLASQAETALKNIKNIVEDCSFSLQDIIKIVIYLTDMGNFNELNEIYSKFFGAHKPVRTTVEVKGLPKGSLIEVEAVCFRGS